MGGVVWLWETFAALSPPVLKGDSRSLPCEAAVAFMLSSGGGVAEGFGPVRAGSSDLMSLHKTGSTGRWVGRGATSRTTPGMEGFFHWTEYSVMTEDFSSTTGRSRSRTVTYNSWPCALCRTGRERAAAITGPSDCRAARSDAAKMMGI